MRETARERERQREREIGALRMELRPSLRRSRFFSKNDVIEYSTYKGEILIERTHYWNIIHLFLIC